MNYIKTIIAAIAMTAFAWGVDDMTAAESTPASVESGATAFAWGVDVGSSIDLTTADMSSLDGEAYFGLRCLEWILWDSELEYMGWSITTRSAIRSMCCCAHRSQSKNSCVSLTCVQVWLSTIFSALLPILRSISTVGRCQSRLVAEVPQLSYSWLQLQWWQRYQRCHHNIGEISQQFEYGYSQARDYVLKEAWINATKTINEVAKSGKIKNYTSFC